MNNVTKGQIIKYLHSGYIIFCQKANFADDGKLNAFGLFDLFLSKALPIKMNCQWLIGFGTPFERRQYKGIATIEDPQGAEIYRQEFNANDPSDLYRGNYILPVNLDLESEGLYTAKIALLNWEEKIIWDIERKFWAMLEQEYPSDP